MLERPGTALAQRPLHFFFLLDCSGSMATDGKMRALNSAVREALPHLVEVAAANPHAEMLVRSVAFSTGAWWHVEKPTPVEHLEWIDLRASGYTDLGAGLDRLGSVLQVPPMQERALPPAIVLVSDGMPTDDYQPALMRLLEQPWGARSVRVSVGIGRDADHDMLTRFMGGGAEGPLSASNPEQLVSAIRWASTMVSRAASMAPTPDEPPMSLAPQAAPPGSQDIWG